MKYQLSDKLTQRQKNMLVEVAGVIPGAQCNSIQTNGQNYYTVLIDGFRTYMSEEVIDQLFEKVEIVYESPAEVILEVLPEEKQVEIPVKKASKSVRRSSKSN